ncbi:hypothetical protein NPIL_390651 [Nephila pilipes]|uniref:Uncharacterized protein n=1 Tax=Nephila pilipes TaxID=299642 RepID=A0A8X6MMK1_NEPPI|nr:hypothetical protein NPIL_390651 [Nephila pilipes]
MDVFSSSYKSHKRKVFFPVILEVIVGMLGSGVSALSVMTPRQNVVDELKGIPVRTVGSIWVPECGAWHFGRLKRTSLRFLKSWWPGLVLMDFLRDTWASIVLIVCFFFPRLCGTDVGCLEQCGVVWKTEKEEDLLWVFLAFWFGSGRCWLAGREGSHSLCMCGRWSFSASWKVWKSQLASQCSLPLGAALFWFRCIVDRVPWAG